MFTALQLSRKRCAILRIFFNILKTSQVKSFQLWNFWGRVFKWVVVWSLSRIWLFVTPWTIAHPVFHYLPVFAQIPVHWVGDAIHPSNSLSPTSLVLYFSQHHSLNSLCMLNCFSHVHLCEPMECSPLGFSVYGILWARTLEWVAISFSRGSLHSRDQIWVSCTAGRLFTVRATMSAPPYANNHI